MAIIAQTAPWYVGSGGATSFTRHEAQRFARNIVTSDVYRVTLQDRIATKTLAPAIEQMLWHYAFGKPVEQVQVTVTQGEDLSTLSADDLLARADALRAQLLEAAAEEAAIPAEFHSQP